MNLLKPRGVISLVFVLTLVIGHHGTLSHKLGNDPTRRAEYLDPERKYLLEWEALWSTNRIVFNITVETRGYIAFGLANSDFEAISGGGVDTLIAGMFQQDKAYFLDYHVGRDERLRLDSSQDYMLHSAWESKSHTFISFSIPMDSCDPQDYPITDNKVTLIWAYGEDDDYEESWRFRKRGSYEVYLLDQDYSPKIERDSTNGKPTVLSEENVNTWTISKRMRIPSNETSYFCSIHRAPTLQKKHHVVGSNAPQGISPGIFEPFVGGEAQVCYMLQRPPTTNAPMPHHFCTELFLGWAVGGRSFFTPPHVGLPLGSSPNEYYLVQVHYDNPHQLPSILVDFRMDMFYTSRLRTHEGGLMGVGHDIPGLSPSLLLPPNSANHRIFGHCSSDCTRRIFPSSTGIKVFAGILHSHNSGRRMRLHHFSNEEAIQPVENPWILFDDNYSNRFQQIQHLHEERRILPGDQLTMECSYDTTWNNGSSVVGGYATKQEMCIAFIFYYNRISDYSNCRSEIVSDEYRQHFLGIRNISWSESQLNWVAADQNRRELSGLTVQQISDSYTNWNRRRRQELQRFHEVHPQVGKCSRDLSFRSPEALHALIQSGLATEPITQNVPMNVNQPDDFSGPVGYPHRIRQYTPRKSCSYRGWTQDKQLYHFL